MTECSKPLLLVKKRMRLRGGVEESAAVVVGDWRRGMVAAARARSGARREGRMVVFGEGFWGDSGVMQQCAFKIKGLPRGLGCDCVAV